MNNEQGGWLTATDCPLRSCLGMQASIFRQNSLFSTGLFLPEVAGFISSTFIQKQEMGVAGLL